MNLPVEDAKEEIKASILASNQLIIKAEPGSGKTTRVPLFAYEVLGGSIVVLEPRRIAARLSAEHVAEALGEEVGETVGYRVRYESQVSGRTKILFITEGLFLRLLVDDPFLRSIKAVIIDEFHERSLHTDLALALVRRLQETTRADLRLIVMSATIDLGSLQSFMPEALSLNIEGRVFKVEARYQESQPAEFIEKQISRAIRSHYKSGNVLVFLFSTAEILKTKSRLEEVLGQFEIWPLTSELAKASLPGIYRGARPKVILATNVAETSLTLPGITLVLDGGWHLSGRYSPWSGLPIVEKKKIAKDSAIQRMGRAGRVEAGVCVRLYARQDFDYRSDFTTPEVSRVDLAQTLLELLGLELMAFDAQKRVTFKFKWLQAPELDHIESALSTLIAIGAIDDQGMTRSGALMAKMPMHPRLSAILATGETHGYRGFAALVCGYLSEGGPDTPDIVAACIDHLKGIYSAHFSDKIEKFFMTHAYSKGPRANQGKRDHPIPDTNTALEIILAGFPDRLGKLLPRGAEQLSNGRFRGEYAFSMGRSGVLEQNLPLKDLLLVLAATELKTGQSRKTLISIAAPIEKSLLASLNRVKVEHIEEPAHDGVVYEIEKTFYDSLLLEEKKIRKTPAVKNLASEIKAGWPRIFKDYRILDTYHDIILFMDRRGHQHSFTKLEGEFVDLVISYLADECQNIAQVRRESITKALIAHLGCEIWEEFLREFPAKLKIPSGREVEIHYEADKDPWVQAKLQEFFSASKNFTLSRWQLPVSIHLLSPGGKPLQVTSDLVRFWSGSYLDIQKEMKSRYPKHPWPDRPALAPPVPMGKTR